MKDLLHDKYLLVDTCFLSGALKYASFFDELLTLIQRESLGLCIHPLIRLELLRFARNESEKERIEALLDERTRPLRLPEKILEITEEIYPLYSLCSSVRNSKQVSITDVCVVSYLREYPNKLMFMTFDNGDYPLELLDRVQTGTVDVESQIFTWGLYAYNSEKEKRMQEAFSH